ncbi:MAG: NADH-quinone oxidoreductase subunit N [Phycisphaerales bacterium]|nr:NADH-quinone oxidoreductase subunit N [Phycisphaerales bacterium]
MNAIIIASLGAIILMLTNLFFRKRSKLLSVFALLVVILLIVFNTLEGQGLLFFYPASLNSAFFQFSNFTYLFNNVLILTFLIYILLNKNYLLLINPDHSADIYALLFFVMTGCFLLTSYNNLLSLFLGIEIMTIPLYVLAGMDKKNQKSNEASLKYFLLGAFSTCILLMGITLLYGATGSFALNPFNTLNTTKLLGQVGMLFIFFALLFKVGVAPFHFWVPDVYDGTPNVFTAFMATIVKVVVIIALLNFINALTPNCIGKSYKTIVLFVIISTLAIGNFSALSQPNVKRMMAYSSIAQAGFMLLALYALNDLATQGILIYAIVYSLSTLTIFAILNKFSLATFSDFNGLAKSQPLMACFLTVALLSLTGIPLTGGFFAKYYMLSATFFSGGKYALPLVIICLIFAGISAVYYLKVIQAMYFTTPPVTSDHASITIQPLATLEKSILLLVVIAILFLGIFPSIVTQWLYF